MRHIFVRFISERQKVAVKVAIEDISLFFAGVFASYRWSANFYYLLFNGQFKREMQAVLKARDAYKKSLTRPGLSSALLRRNIHRLEKGLIMQPRRPVFASDYIGETVCHYQDVRQYPDFDQAELRWAFQVLSNYFSAVHAGQNLLVDAARQAFLAVPAVDCNNFESSIPYTKQQIAISSINFDSLSKLFKQRRSVRWFLPRPVNPQLIRQAVNIASQAPSACNRQPFRFDLINGQTNSAKIASLAMGTTGFAENIPCLLVVIGDLSCYPAERDRHVIYIDASLATMQLMLALETLGLSTCPINWPDIEFREKLMQQKLGLEIYERPVMLLAVGYADPEGGIAYSQKKDDQLLVREIHHVD